MRTMGWVSLVCLMYACAMRPQQPNEAQLDDEAASSTPTTQEGTTAEGASGQTAGYADQTEVSAEGEAGAEDSEARAFELEIAREIRAALDAHDRPSRDELVRTTVAALRAPIPDATTLRATISVRAARADDADHEACELGDTSACERAGAAALDGSGQGMQRALDLWTMGCWQGGQDACRFVATTLFDGAHDGWILDRLQPACDRGRPAACAAVGRALERHESGAGRETLARACPEAPEACVYAWALQGEDAADATVARLLEAGCAGGDPRACAVLTLDESQRVDTGNDEHLTARTGELCAALGEPTACAAYTLALWRDPSAPIPTPALATLEHGCTHGAALQCALVADALVHAGGDLEALGAATPWYITACTLDHAPSCVAFAALLEAVGGAEEAGPILDALRERACTAGMDEHCAAP